jgi:hypothetical protein
LVVLGSYLYGATDDDNKELVVFDISDPNNVSEVASYNATGSADAISLAGSGTLLLLGREGSGEDELYVLDVTTPIAPILSDSAEIGNEVSGLDIDGSFAYLATDQNDEEFQRWDISMPTAIVRTSVLDLDVDGNSIYFSLSHAFVVTDQDNFELIVVGAGSAPDDVVREGTYTSQAFDAGSSVDWDSIEWTESGTGDIVFRVRTADTQANLAMASWVGFDGTPSDTYDTSGQSLTTATGDDTRWIQFKAYFTGNGSTAPVLEDVTLYYE